MPLPPLTRGAVLLCAAVLAALGADTAAAQGDAARAVPWYDSGSELIADFHTHTILSDGANSLGDLAQLASVGGCEVLAATDPPPPVGARFDVTAAERLAVERLRYPDLVLVAGLEWGVPPHAERQRMAVLLPPAAEAVALADFHARFEARGTATDAFRWLSEKAGDGVPPALIYLHPNRSARNAGAALANMRDWRGVSNLVVAFEGSPGRQAASPHVGGYAGDARLRDRFDPVVDVGEAWDTLLGEGHDVWGALASSGYRSRAEDFAPCAFSRTHLTVPERSPEGVLQALRAGSFWAGNGQLVDRLMLTARREGAVNVARPGEVMELPAGVAVGLEIELRRGIGGVLAPLRVEFIGNCADGEPRVLHSAALNGGESRARFDLAQLATGADARSCYVRARVTGEAATVESAARGSERLAAYTNAIRLVPVALPLPGVAGAVGHNIALIAGVGALLLAALGWLGWRMRRRAAGGSAAAASKRAHSAREFRYASSVLSTAVHVNAAQDAMVLSARGREEERVPVRRLLGCRMLLNEKEVAQVQRGGEATPLDDIYDALEAARAHHMGPSDVRRVDLVLDHRRDRAGADRISHPLNYYYRTGNNRVTSRSFEDACDAAVDAFEYFARLLGRPVASETEVDDDPGGATEPPRDAVADEREARPARGTDGVADELEKLARMRRDGLLTEPEFARAKARLLGE